MFDMSNYVTRYFDVKLKDGTELQLEPPKLKVLRKMASLAKLDGNNFDDEALSSLVEAVTLALNKNKTGYTVTAEQVEETFDITLMYNFLTSFFNWVNELQNQKN